MLRTETRYLLLRSVVDDGVRYDGETGTFLFRLPGLSWDEVTSSRKTTRECTRLLDAGLIVLGDTASKGWLTVELTDLGRDTLARWTP